MQVWVLDKRFRICNTFIATIDHKNAIYFLRLSLRLTSMWLSAFRHQVDR